MGLTVTPTEKYFGNVVTNSSDPEMRERDFYLMFLAVATVFVLLVDQLGVRSAARRKSKLKPANHHQMDLSSQQELQTMSSTPRILCYGDSLTAGTSPLGQVLYPYAPHLERALHQQTTLRDAVVRHRGLPGWTSEQMLADANGELTGLRTAIQAGFPIDLVILLAGTNDLAYGDRPEPIVQTILGLHQLCYDEGVKHTIAIGIPSSGYQSTNQQVKLLAQTINNELANFSQRDPRTTFVPFPFGFQYDDEKWAMDGLHFSPLGYKVLGESLAPTVDFILKREK